MNNQGSQPLLDSDRREDISDLNPWETNGGSVVAIAGEDYAIIAADTMLTNDQRKLFPLTPNSMLGCSGCWWDILGLTEQVQMRRQIYEQTHKREMSTDAVAQLLSVLLYERRFFPYLVYTILAGIDKAGKGAVFSYDVIGHCERSAYFANGNSGKMLLPVLDTCIGLEKTNFSSQETSTLTKEQAVAIVVECLNSTGERDAALINIITKDGVEERSMALKNN